MENPAVPKREPASSELLSEKVFLAERLSLLLRPKMDRRQRQRKEGEPRRRKEDNQ
jgi:hypothetical protein